MTKISKIWTASIAYVALAFGAGLSIMYNVLQTMANRGDALVTADVVTAVAMPTLVVFMVELFVSRWWIGRAWYLQVLRWLATIGIGGVAMYASWTHGHAWMLGHGQDKVVAITWPLAIDLLAIMATALILAGRMANGQVAMAKPPVATGYTVDDVLAIKDQATLAKWADEVATGQYPPATWVDHAPGGQDDGHGHDDDGCPDPVATRPLTEWDVTKLATDLAAWDRGVDLAIRDAGQELVTETQAHLGKPAPAVPVTTGVPEEARELITAWLHAPDGPAHADLRELLAAHFGRSDRTIRRWMMIVAKPVSAPPNQAS